MLVFSFKRFTWPTSISPCSNFIKPKVHLEYFLDLCGFSQSARYSHLAHFIQRNDLVKINQHTSMFPSKWQYYVGDRWTRRGTPISAYMTCYHSQAFTSFIFPDRTYAPIITKIWQLLVRITNRNVFKKGLPAYETMGLIGTKVQWVKYIHLTYWKQLIKWWWVDIICVWGRVIILVSIYIFYCSFILL